MAISGPFDQSFVFIDRTRVAVDSDAVPSRTSASGPPRSHSARIRTRAHAYTLERNITQCEPERFGRHRHCACRELRMPQWLNATLSAMRERVLGSSGSLMMERAIGVRYAVRRARAAGL